MSETALEIKNVHFSYGSVPVLFDINCAIPKNRFVSLVGPNGSGKSTLLWLLSGMRKPQNGEILHNGINVSRMNIQERARKFAVITQKESNQLSFTCLETVMLGLHPHRSRFSKLTRQQMELVWNAMELSGVQQFANRNITQISGGEFQRVIIARAIVQQPEILFMDEAISSLDISEKIRIHKQLRALMAKNGLTVISISHDIDTVNFSDDVLALKKGTMAAFGPPNEVFTESFFETVFNVKAEILPGKGFFIRDTI
mgnify:CR=1 FL=1